MARTEAEKQAQWSGKTPIPTNPNFISSPLGSGGMSQSNYDIYTDRATGILFLLQVLLLN